MYLNYYKKKESHDGDHAPIGIILCAGKNEALVKYANNGLDTKSIGFKVPSQFAK